MTTNNLKCTVCEHEGCEVPRGNWRGFKTGVIICKKCYYKQYAENNVESIRQTKIRWIYSDIERYKKTQIRWRKANNKKMLAKTRKYQAAKINAVPKWLTGDHLQEIEKIYINCPIGYHVDHIVPLQGKNVCGLHVPWNLQYLPAKENHSKGNRYD